MTRNHPVQKVIALSIVVTIVGVFLPWGSIFGVSVYGFRTSDGQITLALAGLGMLLLVLRWARTASRETGVGRRGSRWLEVPQILFALVVVAAAAANAADVASKGIYVALVGGAGWLIAAAYSLMMTPKRTVEPLLGEQSPEVHRS